MVCTAAAASADPLDQPVQMEPLASRALLLDVARAGTRLVAVGERGIVLLSDNEGRNWTQSAGVPSRTMLTAVCFATATRGWAVGHDEIILATTDGGRTWSRQHYAPESQQPLLDVLCLDSQRAIAVGAYGSYFTTVDEGSHWSGRKFSAAPLVSPVKKDAAIDDEFAPDYHLNAIADASPDLFIAAEAGHIYRSTDAGDHWQTLSSPYRGSFFGLLPLPGGSLLVFGLRGNLFLTRDAGVSWQKIETGTSAMLTGGQLLEDGGIVIVGLSGTVLVSHDGGAHFTLQQQADRKGLSAAVVTGPARILAVGEGGSRQIDVTCDCAAPGVKATR